MALVIVHPFWPTSSRHTTIGALEGDDYIGSLTSLIKNQPDGHVALYESPEFSELTKYLLMGVGIRDNLRFIDTRNNSSVLCDESQENDWLKSIGKVPILCAGGCYTLWNKGTPQQEIGDCLGTTMLNLQKKGYVCQLQPKAAYSLKSVWRLEDSQGAIWRL